MPPHPPDSQPASQTPGPLELVVRVALLVALAGLLLVAGAALGVTFFAQDQPASPGPPSLPFDRVLDDQPPEAVLVAPETAAEPSATQSPPDAGSSTADHSATANATSAARTTPAPPADNTSTSETGGQPLPPTDT